MFITGPGTNSNPIVLTDSSGRRTLFLDGQPRVICTAAGVLYSAPHGCSEKQLLQIDDFVRDRVNIHLVNVVTFQQLKDLSEA
jgi:hypothetical protein